MALFSTNHQNYKTIIDEANPNCIYIGEAEIGSSIYDDVWRIKRILISGSVTSIQYANGDRQFDNVWNDRLTLIYE